MVKEDHLRLGRIEGMVKLVAAQVRTSHRLISHSSRGISHIRVPKIVHIFAVVFQQAVKAVVMLVIMDRILLPLVVVVERWG